MFLCKCIKFGVDNSKYRVFRVVSTLPIPIWQNLSEALEKLSDLLLE